MELLYVCLRQSSHPGECSGSGFAQSRKQECVRGATRGPETDVGMAGVWSDRPVLMGSHPPPPSRAVLASGRGAASLLTEGTSARVCPAQSSAAETIPKSIHPNVYPGDQGSAPATATNCKRGQSQAALPLPRPPAHPHSQHLLSCLHPRLPMRLKHTVTLLVASFGTAGAALCSGHLPLLGAVLARRKPNASYRDPCAATGTEQLGTGRNGHHTCPASTPAPRPGKACSAGRTTGDKEVYFHHESGNRRVSNNC